MPSTHTSLHYHLVFSTKNREPWINATWRDDLHHYLGGIIRGLGGFSEGVGGVEDHVHILVSLKATHRLADFMRDLKRSSSIWVAEHIGLREFGWQDGYAAFTVSATAKEKVQAYIANQEAHHSKKGFRDELIDLLKRSGVQYDERYLD
jgi:REP element-mobilizing transposase RayT